MNTIMRTIGGALGAQIAASIVAGTLSAHRAIPTESGYTAAFLVSAVVVFFAFITSLLIPGRRSVGRRE